MTWPEKRLGDVAEVRLGRQRSPKNATGDHMAPYMRAANVQDGWLDLSDVKTMNFSPDEQDTYALRPGDVLVTEGSGSIDTVGATAVWDAEIAGVVAFQNTLLRIRAIPTEMDQRFAYHLARWMFWEGRWADLANGTNIHHIGARRATAASVPVPPLEVQRRIVDLIDHIDHVVASGREAESKARAALDSLREELVDGPKTMGRVAKVGSGPSWKSDDETTQAVEGSVPVVKITNTAPDGSFDLTEMVHVTDLPDSTSLIGENSLVLIRTNGNRSRIGNVYRPPAETHGSAVSAFQMLADVDPSYSSALLYHGLARQSVQRAMSQAASGTTGLGNLSVKWLRRLPIPQHSESVRLLPALEALEDEFHHHHRQVVAAVAARSALLADCLTGETAIPDSYDRFIEEVAA